jgi:hypothetical protein
MSHGIAWLFPFALRFKLLLPLFLIQGCLTLGPWSSAQAQLDIGIGGGSRGGDRDRDIGREHDRGRDVRTGIGIGIEIGRTIEQNSTTSPKGPPPEKKYGRKDGNNKKKDGDNKTARTDDKKTDDKKTDDKKPDDKNVATVDDCLMIIQYGDDDEIPADGATNTDLKGSAMAVKASLKGTHDEQTVTSEQKIDDALKKLTEDGKKCCKRIMIFGHGYKDGSLKVPYPTYEGGDGDKAKHVGGDSLQQTDGQKAFQTFSDRIKKALCKDPKSQKLADGAEVRIHACWSADNVNQDHSIAEELSKKGITSSGYKDVVRFPYSTPEGKPDERTYSPPTPDQAGQFQTLKPEKVSAK